MRTIHDMIKTCDELRETVASAQHELREQEKQIKRALIASSQVEFLSIKWALLRRAHK